MGYEMEKRLDIILAVFFVLAGGTCVFFGAVSTFDLLSVLVTVIGVISMVIGVVGLSNVK